jgi:hypothetical protein
MLEFQVLSWHAEDMDLKNGDASPTDGEEEGRTRLDPKDVNYVIKAFGRSKSGESVSLTITDFKPYFYVKLPDKWTPSCKERFRAALEDTKLPCFRNVYSYEVVERKDLWGYTNFRAFKFMKISFNSCKFMRFAASHFNTRGINYR